MAGPFGTQTGAHAVSLTNPGATGSAASSTPWTAIAYAVIRGAEEAKRTVTKAIDAIKSAITSLADQFKNLKSIILDTVSAFQPFTVVMFNRAILDLKATMGQIFLPILKQMTIAVRAVADTIYNIPQVFKDMARAVASVVLAISGFLAGSTAIAGVIAAVVVGIASLSAALVVLGALAVTVGAVLAAILLPWIPLLTIISSVVVALGGLVVVFVQLIRMMLRTEGGMKLLNTVMRGFDQIVNTVAGAINLIKSGIGFIIDYLYDALSSLGDALSELFDALKPLIAGGLVIVIGAIATALTLFVAVLTGVVKVLTAVSRLIMMLPMMRALRAFSELMPESKEKKSAYGLGWSHAEVGTDANALYNKITEELLRNTRGGGGEPEQDPNKKVAANTDKFSDLLVKALNKYLEGTPGPFGLAMRLGAAARGLFE